MGTQVGTPLPTTQYLGPGPWIPGEQPAMNESSQESQQEPATDDSDESELPLNPPLSAMEARVLGCLIEKEATTPETYPLTQNATVTACNQKSSRNPVMKLDPGRVGQTLRALEQRRLVRS